MRMQINRAARLRRVARLCKSVLCFFLIISDSYSQWFDEPITNTSQSLSSIFFVSEMTGYTGGYSESSGGGAVYKTTDGGDSWNLCPAVFQGNIVSVFFVNPGTGYAASANYLYKTTNSGMNWIQLSSPQGNFKNLFFISDSTGWAGGDIIARTTDGGNSWGVRYAQGGYGIMFVTGAVGFALGNDSIKSMLVETTNSGNNWFAAGYLPYNTFRGLYFINIMTGWVCRYSVPQTPYCIAKTTDAGSSWMFQMTKGYEGGFSAVYFNDYNTGWAAGNEVWGTLNSGDNWSMQNTPYNANWQSIFFINQTTGWIAGYDFSTQAGRIIKTTNGGGLIGIQPVSNEIPASFALYQNYPNPFNSKSKIKYQIAKTSFVTLTIFDALGHAAESLVNEQLNPGTYEVEWDARNYPSGVYYYRLGTRDFVQTRKMILIR